MFHDALVKVAVAGYCHSEIPVQNGDAEVRWLTELHNQTLPIIPSHEGTGIVVAVGSGVINFKVQQNNCP
jgi:D-arabinose 1-dehydrogenase-like Zn-dependent alcohol dehydrogenase